jgi:hypothetical protein
MAQDAPLTYEERQLAMFIIGPWVSILYLLKAYHQPLFTVDWLFFGPPSPGHSVWPGIAIIYMR